MKDTTRQLLREVADRELEVARRYNALADSRVRAAEALRAGDIAQHSVENLSSARLLRELVGFRDTSDRSMSAMSRLDPEAFSEAGLRTIRTIVSDPSLCASLVEGGGQIDVNGVRLPLDTLADVGRARAEHLRDCKDPACPVSIVLGELIRIVDGHRAEARR